MKILWALDPFHTNKDQQQFAARIIRAISSSNDDLTAVYVASNAEAELATAFDIPVTKRYSLYPKRLMKVLLKRLEIKKIKIEILFERSLSLTALVKQITDYTRKKKTDLILISANNKKFLPRLIFGSFAESMVHLSTCDLFIFHQRTKMKNESPKTIIFAHDFTAKGTLGLERAIFYAKNWQSLLTIVHIPFPEVGMTLEDFEERTQKKLRKLETYMQKQRVKFQIAISPSDKPASETILKMAAARSADIIAVAAQAKKLEAFLGGSTTRQILRESELPTLILKV